LSPTELFAAQEPGVYPGIPGHLYHSVDCVSNSRLKPLAEKSPQHCKHVIDTGVTPTDAMAFGTGVHAWCLEPETLERDFAVAQQCAARKKDGARCDASGRYFDDGEWFCGRHKGHLSDETNPDVNVITQERWDQMAAARAQVYANHTARELLDDTGGHNELSILATHDVTGLNCKLRADIWRPSFGCIGDIKTCQDASPRAFERTMVTYGYYRQAAFYQHFAQQAGLDAESFVFIAVESSAPYAVGVYELDATALAVGWAETERLLAQYAECLAADDWPGYGSKMLELPKWKVDQFEKSE